MEGGHPLQRQNPECFPPLPASEATVTERTGPEGRLYGPRRFFCQRMRCAQDGRLGVSAGSFSPKHSAASKGRRERSQHSAACSSSQGNVPHFLAGEEVCTNTCLGPRLGPVGEPPSSPRSFGAAAAHASSRQHSVNRNARAALSSSCPAAGQSAGPMRINSCGRPIKLRGSRPPRSCRFLLLLCVASPAPEHLPGVAAGAGRRHPQVGAAPQEVCPQVLTPPPGTPLSPQPGCSSSSSVLPPAPRAGASGRRDWRPIVAGRRAQRGGECPWRSGPRLTSAPGSG